MVELSCNKDNEICEYYNKCKSHTEKDCIKIQKAISEIFENAIFQLNTIPSTEKIEKLKLKISKCETINEFTPLLEIYVDVFYEYNKSKIKYYKIKYFIFTIYIKIKKVFKIKSF